MNVERMKKTLSEYGVTFSEQGYVVNENITNLYFQILILEKLTKIEQSLRIFDRKTVIVESSEAEKGVSSQ